MRSGFWSVPGRSGMNCAPNGCGVKDMSTAIVFLEQMYPFPEAELEAEFERHSGARDIVWVQEEPSNMGALFYMLPRFKRIAGDRPVLSVKRSGSASPATGSAQGARGGAENNSGAGIHHAGVVANRDQSADFDAGELPCGN